MHVRKVNTNIFQYYHTHLEIGNLYLKNTIFNALKPVSPAPQVQPVPQSLMPGAHVTPGTQTGATPQPEAAN